MREMVNAYSVDYLLGDKLNTYCELRSYGKKW